MRVWDVHPGYLSRQSLLGQHVEIHAIYSVISRGLKGYANHPETLRWVGNLDRLRLIHEVTVLEMALRGYRHASPLAACPKDGERGENDFAYVDLPAGQFGILAEKYGKNGQAGRIPLPRKSSDYWANHKYAVMARGYAYYKEVQSFMGQRQDLPIGDDGELIAMVMDILDKEPQRPALNNTADHLWGYFKKLATSLEKDDFDKLRQDAFCKQTDFFYSLALKYDVAYLKHSTVFADPGLTVLSNR